MIKRELTCIGCPLGCSLDIEIIEGKEIKVSGNGCKKGEVYVIKECTNPTRIVTTTIPVKNGREEVVPVKTERDIPMDKIFKCIELLSDITVKAPVNIGDIVAENVLGTGVNIVATRNICVK